MNKEFKRLYITLGAIALVVLGIVVLIFSSSKKSENFYNEFIKDFQSGENKLIYIGRPTCAYCNLLSPNLEEMAERYNFEYLYVNIDEISTQVVSQILSDMGLTSVGTPYLAVVSKGKVVDTQNGFTDYDKTFEFLQENKIIDEEAMLLLDYIDYEEYTDLIKEDKLNVVVVGQSTCQYCIRAKLILNQIVEEKEIDINYFNVSYLEEKDVEGFESSLDIFKSEWGTPTTLIVRNGKVVASLTSLVSKTEYINFFKANGVIE